MTSQAKREKEIMEEARRLFVDEALTRIPEAQQAINKLAVEGYNAQDCAVIYKFGHTLKGSGQTVGLWEIADPAAEIAVAALLIQKYKVLLGEDLLTFFKERIKEIIDAVNDFLKEKHLPNTSTIPETVARKVLVVDDDVIVTKVVKEGLEKHGFCVTVCNDLATAESYLEIEQPELIVLDIVMPSGDGIDFCRKIRSDRRLQIVPIIFLTIKSKLQDKIAGFSTGADDYLCKPFQVEELVARIKAILDRINKYKDLVLKDELTKIYNRRYLDQRLEEEIARGERTNGNFSVVMIDLNLFKNINDRYGHVVGDEVLKGIVGRMKEKLRASDVICRYGGDEFVVILPETTKNETRLTMQRFEHEISLNPLELPNNNLKISMTISYGIASYPENGKTVLDLLTVADNAMYQNKEKRQANNVKKSIDC